MPQGSVLGPLFADIYVNSLLLSLNNSEVCNYADDKSLFAYVDIGSAVAWQDLIHHSTATNFIHHTVE